ncbi:voltage-dependent anion channel-domain-containing protein [Podospora didyma]|uniref:Voltage-dependent anion channel-domain-containing protein n=1 Tax=Podospora didyma TaxID=330526 RepID=A0AAE0N376_9PEZI|nr:voltage-dependent anion channel-domain-containing protein [Podospora didyma]
MLSVDISYRDFNDDTTTQHQPVLRPSYIREDTLVNSNPSPFSVGNSKNEETGYSGYPSTRSSAEFDQRQNPFADDAFDDEKLQSLSTIKAYVPPPGHVIKDETLVHRRHHLHPSTGADTLVSHDVDDDDFDGGAISQPATPKKLDDPEQQHQHPATRELKLDLPAPTADAYSPTRPKLGLRARLAHFTWAWYTLVMSTGGLALLIAAQPHQFPGLHQIGLTIYIINIILFTLVTSALVARFFLFAGSFKKSITHPREGFFFPTFFLSLATLITGTQKYAVPVTPNVSGDVEQTGLLWAMQVAFWAYLAVTTALAVGQYSYVFASHSHGLQTMMPTWILPIFPVMLSGTVASVVAGAQPEGQAVQIIIAGLSCQGLGLSMAVLMYAHMVGRLMQTGLPNREHRPGLFMCVGPPSFTALAFIGLANGLPANFDHDFDGLLDASIIRTMAIVSAGFLWSLSFWWFAIAVLAVLQSRPKYFHLGWWASVFPNTGFILATISIGKEFGNDAVLWFATAMSILLLLTYSFVLFHHIRAVVVQDIMYPGRDEDVEDH